MKKSASILILLISIVFHTFGQTVEPQFWFYSKTAPVLGNNANDIDEHNILSLQVLFGNHFSNAQIMEMYYRMYEIQNTSIIRYTTADFEKLPFQLTDGKEIGLQKVDFGAELIENTSNQSTPTWCFEYQLGFGTPVQRIDPQLFSEQMEEVRLPASSNLTYISSPEIMTTNLSIIEGYDVFNYSALISKDSTLIVAATKYQESYQIPNIVKRIGAGALRGSRIKSLTLPSSIIAIGEKAFDQSDILTYHLLPTEVPTLGEFAFGEQISKKVTIYVPKESLKAYKKAWKPLKRHIKALPRSYNYDLAKDEFDINCSYWSCYGLQLTEDGHVINKNNRFINKDLDVRLNEKEANLWKYMRYYDMDIDWLSAVLYNNNDDYLHLSTAYDDCLSIMKKWFDEGIICKSSQPSFH